MVLFLRRFTLNGGTRDLLGRRFLLRRLLRCFSPFPLLITAVVKLLIGRLFLHTSIMSQITPAASFLIHVATAASAVQG